MCPSTNIQLGHAIFTNLLLGFSTPLKKCDFCGSQWETYDFHKRVGIYVWAEPFI